MPNGELQVEVDKGSIATITNLARVMRSDPDGKKIRKEFVAELKTAVEPGIASVQEKLRAVPHQSAVQSSPPLGSYLASRVKAQVNTSGRRAGVRIRVPTTPQLRGFRKAAAKLNRDSWRHPVFGSDRWVTQTSPIRGYFDETLQKTKPQLRSAVVKVLEKFARRMAGRP